VLEEVSGQDLKVFFDQWVYRAGQPKLDAKWSYADQVLTIEILQKQTETFQFTLDVDLVLEDGSTIRKSVDIASESTSATFTMEKKPVEIVLDPDTWLLFEAGKVIAL